MNPSISPELPPNGEGLGQHSGDQDSGDKKQPDNQEAGLTESKLGPLVWWLYGFLATNSGVDNAAKILETFGPDLEGLQPPVSSMNFSPIFYNRNKPNVPLQLGFEFVRCLTGFLKYIPIGDSNPEEIKNFAKLVAEHLVLVGHQNEKSSLAFDIFVNAFLAQSLEKAGLRNLAESLRNLVQIECKNIACVPYPGAEIMRQYLAIPKMMLTMLLKGVQVQDEKNQPNLQIQKIQEKMGIPPETMKGFLSILEEFKNVLVNEFGQKFSGV